jgi:lipopolysaccharide/colanic/teichoic acid biosynthesis glycosyltransferase
MMLLTHNRIGELGKPFRYFKFRSMIDKAHQYRFDEKFLKEHENIRAGTPMMKFKNDPRITKVGRLLRRFSIDELPELLNVFIGKMSLVGPRPHEVEEVEKYESYHRRVLSIKPGMTGMAQVAGRSDLDFNEEVRLDIWYMENWSMKLDLMILFKTPLAVLKKRKAE